MASKISPEKKVDLPPAGRRNADPITNAPGSHPIETGIGAAAAGAATGMVAGAFTGPVGAAVGAAVGAVAGGLDELGEAAVGDRDRVDPEGRQVDLADRALAVLREAVGVLGAHQEAATEADHAVGGGVVGARGRSEEHTSELQSPA